MLYSSGTTGHPKGIRRPLTGLPFGSDVVLSGMLGGIMGFGPGTCTSARHRCTTPPRWCGP